MKKQILIIEDELSVAKQLKWGLRKKYDITIASKVNQAKSLIASGAFPVITLDLGLPPFPDTPIEGFKLLSEIISLFPKTKVIVITGNAEKENAVKAIALGATDFCPKPVDLNLLEIILSRSFKIHELETANQQILHQTSRSGSLCNMVGTSPNMVKLFESISKVSQTDYPVLITGKSGTGKELAACAVHNLSKRAEKPLIIINCGAIPENLLESELFGHEKGAFTGAVNKKNGRFKQADKGSLFLDEIGDLPLPMQVKLLRFLQEGTIDPLGKTETIHLDIRIIAATNINLEDAVKKKIFREDLFYRLNVVPLKIPALKNRNEDILILAQHFLFQETSKLKREKTTFSEAALTAMITYKWPGNIRELQNRIRRALGSSSNSILTPVDMGFEDLPVKHSNQKLLTLKQARTNAEIKTIHQAMTLTSNNISQAAKLLKVSRPTLHDLLKKHKIQPAGHI